MNAPKVKTLKSRGSRFYIHPTDDRKVPGVTSVLNMMPKPFLKWWAAKKVAEGAVQHIEILEKLARDDPEGAVDWLKRAPDRDVKDAADQGTGAHGLFEKIMLGQPVGEVIGRLVPFLRQFEDLLNHIEPNVLRAEDTVWSDTYSYAGSFDYFLEVDNGIRSWVDVKTTRSGVHKDAAYQLSAYAHADYIIDGDTGEQLLLPESEQGLVFHVRPDFWAVHEVPIGDDVFEGFLALRHWFEHDRLSDLDVVGKPVLQGAVKV
jgi:hypothetical protein